MAVCGGFSFIALMSVSPPQNKRGDSPRTLVLWCDLFLRETVYETY